jgi:hypothetical protein
MDKENSVQGFMADLMPDIQRSYPDIANQVASRIEAGLRAIETRGELQLIREVKLRRVLGSVQINFKSESIGGGFGSAGKPEEFIQIEKK